MLTALHNTMFRSIEKFCTVGASKSFKIFKEGTIHHNRCAINKQL